MAAPRMRITPEILQSMGGMFRPIQEAQKQKMRLPFDIQQLRANQLAIQQGIETAKREETRFGWAEEDREKQLLAEAEEALGKADQGTQERWAGQAYQMLLKDPEVRTPDGTIDLQKAAIKSLSMLGQFKGEAAPYISALTGAAKAFAPEKPSETVAYYRERDVQARQDAAINQARQTWQNEIDTANAGMQQIQNDIGWMELDEKEKASALAPYQAQAWFANYGKGLLNDRYNTGAERELKSLATDLNRPYGEIVYRYVQNLKGWDLPFDEDASRELYEAVKEEYIAPPPKPATRPAISPTAVEEFEPTGISPLKLTPEQISAFEKHEFPSTIQSRLKRTAQQYNREYSELVEMYRTNLETAKEKYPDNLRMAVNSAMAKLQSALKAAISKRKTEKAETEMRRRREIRPLGRFPQQ